MYLIENHLVLGIRDNKIIRCWRCYGEGLIETEDDCGNPVIEVCPECDGAGEVEERLFW